MKILVTGAGGFIGKNLVCNLRSRGYKEVFEYTRNSSAEDLERFIGECDFVFHLAGVNRPLREEEFDEGNAQLTRRLTQKLKGRERAVPLLLTSSVQAGLDNRYGISKRAAEEAVFEYGRVNNAPVYVYRLPGVFGKWSRSDYNTVVATFCHRTARGEGVRVDDPERLLRLVYIDDVVEMFMRCLEAERAPENGKFAEIPEELIHEVTLGDLKDIITSFRKTRENLSVPDMSDRLVSRLYSTYLSFLPEDGFSYPLLTHSDARGSFTEFIRTEDRGQFSVNVAHPGIAKGQHWHNSKNEKFLVVRGEALIRFRKIGTSHITDYHVSGEKLEVVDIPTGYTHCIINVGSEDLVTLMWASEPFNPDRPDTYYEEV